MTDNRTTELSNVVCGLHDALVDAVVTIVELDAEKAGGYAMAVDYYAYKLREIGFDIPPTPMEEFLDGDADER